LIVSYNEQVGERLRSIRRQRGFSLQDVQRISDGEFKAAVLGAYERGERSLSVPRLHRLAGYYGVPVVQLLPPDPAAVVIDPDRESVTIDLERLGSLAGPEGAMIERFLSSIQMERQDFNGKVLTVRSDDLRLLSRLIGESDEFTDRIDEVRISLRP
jgi:transcriptional regulator with XRE-family HTH domain